jgi:putative peptide zinc metalloprotease protein
LTVIRAGSPGFVRQVHVSDGQQVRPGDVLVVLENPQLRMELADLELALNQLDLKRRSLTNSHRMAELQAHEQHRLALEKKRAEKADRVRGLTVRATVDGKVIARNLESLLGVYLDEGAQILALADERQKQLKVSICQENTDPFTANVAGSVRVRLPGVPVFTGTLTDLAPRADVEPSHPALCAHFGGPLAVRATNHDRDDIRAADPRFELFVPRLAGTIELTAAQSARLRAGQRGVASLSSYHECIADHLYRAAAAWVRDRYRHATS